MNTEITISIPKVNSIGRYNLTKNITTKYYHKLELSVNDSFEIERERKQILDAIKKDFPNFHLINFSSI